MGLQRFTVRLLTGGRCLIKTNKFFFKIMTTFLPSTKHSHKPLPTLIQIHGLSFIICCYMHACIYTCITTCNLLNLYNETLRGMYRTDHLALDNRLLCFSPEKTPSLALGSPLCRVEPSWTFPLWNLPLVSSILVQLTFGRSSWCIF